VVPMVPIVSVVPNMAVVKDNGGSRFKSSKTEIRRGNLHVSGILETFPATLAHFWC
jgi:hypothetical protein